MQLDALKGSGEDGSHMDTFQACNPKHMPSTTAIQRDIHNKTGALLRKGKVRDERGR